MQLTMDADVLPRVAEGDRAAVQQCIDRYGGLVWSLARRYLGDSAEAEDAVQEVFIAVWENAGRFNPATAGEATYVAMIARRRLIDRLRSRRHREARTPTVPVAEIEARLADPRGSTDRVEASLDLQRVAQALGALGPGQRQAVLLSLAHGLSHSEVAAATGQPLGTVKAQIRRGLGRLRDLLGAAPASQRGAAT